MPSSYLVLTIIGMFVVTFGIRFVLFATAQKTCMPEWLESGLKYVPVSVLTAIIAPMSITNDQGLDIALSNPWFVGALTSLLVGLVTKHQLLTICIGVTTFFVTKLMVAS